MEIPIDIFIMEIPVDIFNFEEKKLDVTVAHCSRSSSPAVNNSDV